MALVESDLTPHRPLRHFTPLRYPGGKGKLAAYLKALLKFNRLLDGEYVEPYAGGAAIALELLFHEYVSHIHINDVSKPIHSFWDSVLNYTEELRALIVDVPLDVQTWDEQKAVLGRAEDASALELGFATFYLNRTNRSGILNGGIIGGRDQSGPWKIDARFNSKELVHRIQSIARMRDRISLTRKDAFTFLKKGLATWPEETLIYLDPPYYVKGRDLYLNFYQHSDHGKIATLMIERRHTQRWIVSYDNVGPIRSLYAATRYITYDIGYSARSASRGSEVMFFCDGLKIPPLVGPICMTNAGLQLA